MGRTKNLLQEIPPTEEPIIEEISPRDELIQRLINKTIHLSYSKLKNLDSPINFINAILQPKKKNDGMTLGSIVDCKLLSESEFDRKYTVVEKEPTTDIQKAFVEMVMEEMKMEKITDEAIQEKIEVVKKISKAQKPETLIPFIREKLLGKEVVSQEQMDKAMRIVENLKHSYDVMDELAEAESFQKELRFEYNDWEFLSYLDIAYPKGFADLKYSSDCSKKQFERDIINFGYDDQIGVYAIGYEVLYGISNPEVKFIVYDALGNYNIFPIDEEYVTWCKKKIDFKVNCLDKMISERAFNKSYNYFSSKNTIYKPRWVEGFDYEIFSK